MPIAQISLANARSDANVGVTPASAGALAGERVQGKDLASILSDSREEMSVIMAEKLHTKDISEREVKGAGGHHGLQIEQIEKINAYLEATKRFRSPQELAEVIKQVRNSAHPELAASKHGGRAATRYALLQLAGEGARKDGASLEEIDKFLFAAADTIRGREDEVHADLNTAHVAADFAPDASGVETFQRTYSDIVLGRGSLADTLQLVLRRLSGVAGEKLADAMKALQLALGADLSSTRSSTQSVRLQALVQDLYHLQVAVSVLESCGQVSRDLASRFQLSGVIPMELMQELVAMSNDRWLTPQRLRELATRFGVQLLLARIAFYGGTKHALRKMPVKVFPDGEVRRAMLDTFQQVEDEAIAEEEERQGA